MNYIKTERYEVKGKRRKQRKKQGRKEISFTGEETKEDGIDDEEEDLIPERFEKVWKQKPQERKDRIKRPIICICNDLYCKLLRPLREVAEVFTLKKMNQPKLMKFFQSVLAKQKIFIEPVVLKKFCIRHGFDIRSLLNTFQLISNMKRHKDSLQIITEQSLNEIYSAQNYSKDSFRV